jgi:16S rRNA (cytidine1402-2'-O)-methyltransferase
MSKDKGILYLVASPIGNLGDMSFRAVDILRSVDLIACEDTRHSRTLLDHFGISNNLVSFHEHNELNIGARLVDKLVNGLNIAILSDAGTPLINDPGFGLVVLAQQAGVRVIPIPGSCALITALTASGLPTDRFCFEGFPPRKSSARKAYFGTLLQEPRTLIFYESSHRIVETIKDVADVFPSERRLSIARELTKKFETIVQSTAGKSQFLFSDNPDMQRGEFVLIIEGAPIQPQSCDLSMDQLRILNILLEECSVRSAVNLLVKITGARKETTYSAALLLHKNKKQ